MLRVSGVGGGFVVRNAGTPHTSERISSSRLFFRAAFTITRKRSRSSVIRLRFTVDHDGTHVQRLR